MATVRRVSVTFPTELVDDLDSIAERLGFTRSGLLTQMLQESIPQMARIIRDIPDQPRKADVIRFRGESVKVYQDTITELNGLMEEMQRDTTGTGDC